MKLFRVYKEYLLEVKLQQGEIKEENAYARGLVKPRSRWVHGSAPSDDLLSVY
jgi:hypothetical protein